MIRVSKSAQALQIERPATKKPGGGVKNPPSMIHFLFNNVYRRKQGDALIQLKTTNRDTRKLKTDVHSAITILS